MMTGAAESCLKPTDELYKSTDSYQGEATVARLLGAAVAEVLHKPASTGKMGEHQNTTDADWLRSPARRAFSLLVPAREEGEDEQAARFPGWGDEQRGSYFGWQAGEQPFPKQQYLYAAPPPKLREEAARRARKECLKGLSCMGKNAGLRQLADEGDTIAEGAPDAGGRSTRQLPHGLEPFPPELNVSQDEDERLVFGSPVYEIAVMMGSYMLVSPGSYMLVSPFFMSAHIVGASFILGQPAGYRRTGWDLPSPVTTSTTRKASMWHMVRRRFWWRSPPSAGDGEGGGEGSAS